MTHSGTVRGQSRHAALGLTDEQVIAMYETMMLARRYDERGLLLQRAGKINFHISGINHEAAQVAMAFATKRATKTRSTRGSRKLAPRCASTEGRR